MGEAKRRKEKDPNFGKSTIAEIDIAKHGKGTFYKWNNQIYNLDADKGLGISIANESSRYVKFKDLIDAAINDLSQDHYKDGKWVFIVINKSMVVGWFPFPISFAELMGVAQYDKTAIEDVPFNTPMMPVMNMKL